MNEKYYWIIDNQSIKSESLKKSLLSIIPKNWIQDYQRSEFIFVIGGDGTVLRNKNIYLNKKIVAINGGNFGFYSYFNKTNLKNIIKQISNDSNFYNPLEIVLEIDNKQYYGLNEVLIRSEKILETKIYINSCLLENFKGSGLMVSSQLGSTAHSKNANGAILCPNLNAIQLLEIEPLTQKKFNTLKSPLVLDGNTKINLKSKIDNNALIIIDGEIIENKFENDCMIFTKQTNYKIFKPFTKQEYWKKIRNSFVRD